MRGRDITTGRFADNGTVPQDELRDKLERVAILIAGKMLGEEEPFDATVPPINAETISMFKAISNFYTATRRLPMQKTEDADDENGFGALKDRIHGAGNNETQADC